MIPTIDRKRTGVALIFVLIAALLVSGCIQTSSQRDTSVINDSVPVHKAKNVIIMVGDGMGPSTVTAARWYKSQNGLGDMYLDQLPYTAVVETDSADRIVTDSAPAATAIFSGRETNNGNINWYNGQEYRTILEEARDSGKSTGAVTTARITHATPAGTYASTPDRDNETDIAVQLLNSNVDVAMGGGYAYFIPATSTDPEYGQPGKRTDGRDLLAEFTARGYDVVWNESQFSSLTPGRDTKVLALFEPGYMQYEADRSADPAGEPSLSDMTARSIDILSRNPDGYFLMVEGGRIDHAHHENKAYKAITDTVEFDDAVRTAASRVDLNDTLIIVVADHSHTMVIGGFPSKNQSIVGTTTEAGKIMPILSYGIGSRPYSEPEWANATPGKDTVYPAGIILGGDSHGGETVTGYAIGPGADRMHGTMHLTSIYSIAHNAMF